MASTATDRQSLVFTAGSVLGDGGPVRKKYLGQKGRSVVMRGPFRADVPITATESITKALTITILSEAPGDSDEE